MKKKHGGVGGVGGGGGGGGGALSVRRQNLTLILRGRVHVGPEKPPSASSTRGFDIMKYLFEKVSHDLDDLTSISGSTVAMILTIYREFRWI